MSVSAINADHGVNMVSVSRKSNCVKEVEKMKQRRAERRAARIAIKEQLEQENDLNSPSWEFEAMIR